MIDTASPQSARDGPADTRDRLRQMQRWAYEAARTVVGPAEEAAQRQDVARRALLAPAIIALLPMYHLPGWHAVLGACAAAVVYDIPLAYLVFVQKRIFLARVLAFLLDALLLSVASLFVLRELGAANSSSDIWLAFLVFAVSGGFVLAPIGSLIYTALATGSFVLGTYLFFPADSQYHDQLLVRVVFFTVFGLMSLGIAQELEKRRMRLVKRNRELAESREELQRLNQQLQESMGIEHHLARTDALTGMPNRRFIDESIAMEAARANRYGQDLAVVMADMDDLKEINDAYGHQAGDESLRFVAEIARQSCRQVDVVGRYGGDEFVFVLPATRLEEAAQFAERFRQRLAASPAPNHSGGSLHLTVSLGVAHWESESLPEPSALVRQADRAMYRAKADGRNRTVVAAGEAAHVA